MPATLEDTEIAAILPRIDSLTAWTADLKEYALRRPCPARIMTA